MPVRRSSGADCGEQSAAASGQRQRRALGLARRSLGVAQHHGAQGGTAGVGLGGQGVANGHRLGGGAEQHAVHLAARATNALAGERVAEVAQRHLQRVESTGGLVARVGAQAAGGVVVQQHGPVVEGDLRAELLAAGRAFGRLAIGVVQPAQPRRGQRGLALCKLGPRELGAGRGLSLGDAHEQPHVEAQVLVAGGGVGEGLEGFVEAGVALGQPLVLGLQRSAQLHKLLVGGEEALAHHRRGGDEVVLLVQQLPVEGGLLGGELAGVGGGQAQHVVGRELGQHHLHQRAPHGHQVVALVEHDGAYAGRAQLGDPLPHRGREQLGGRQLRKLAAGGAALVPRDDADQVAVAARSRLAGPGGDLGFDLLGGVACGLRTLAGPLALRRGAQHVVGIAGLAQRLVGEGVHVGAALAEQRLLVLPLALDGLGGTEH